MLITFLIFISGSTHALNSNLREVGGKAVNPGDFPYVVDIQARGGHWCGGLVYNNDWVVTTASCVLGYRYQPENLNVILGQVDLTTTDPGEESVAVSAVYIHEQYDSLTYKNDVAVLKLARTITLGIYVNGVVLGNVNSNNKAVVTGWGQASDVAMTSLQYVEVPIQPDSKCSASYGGQWDAATMICAGNVTNDACNLGDSGVPMVQGTASEGLQAVGLLSHTLGCSNPLYPTVYTRLFPFISWLENKAGSQSIFVPTVSSTEAPTVPPIESSTESSTVTQTVTPIVTSTETSTETTPAPSQCNKAEIGQFPFVVSISTSNTMEHLCSGFIYNQEFVVTSASCVVRKNGPMLNVTVGQLRFDRPEASAKTFAVASIVLHPQYHESNQSNNIAVLKISGNIEFTENVNFIYYDSADYSSTSCSVTGWASKLDDGCQKSLSLLWDDSESLEINESCLKAFSQFNSTSMLCTKKDASKTCEFEAGAPLVQGDPPSVVGIKSSFGDCSASPVVLYTRVSHYYSWLISIAGYSPAE